MPLPRTEAAPPPPGGPGAARQGGPDAQPIGNRCLSKIPVKARYFDERHGLLFATEDDELTMKVNPMFQAGAKIKIVAIEGLDSLLYPSKGGRNEEMQAQAMAGAYRAFEITRSLVV